MKPAQFTIVSLDSLAWPASLSIPSKYFRLFVAADTANLPVDEISKFAAAALLKGLVNFCAWGAGCERFHDIVDECFVWDEASGENRFKSQNDSIMTTWHEKDTLEEALDFFVRHAQPSEGYADSAEFRAVICVDHPEWAEQAQRFLKDASTNT